VISLLSDTKLQQWKTCYPLFCLVLRRRATFRNVRQENS